MGDSLSETVKSGDRRRILEKLALGLAEAIEAGPEPKDLAALVLRLEKVSAELDALGPAKSGGLSWEERLEARRAAREAAAG